MGIVYGGIPHLLADRLRERCGIRTLVETGTNEGATAAWAATRFSQVLTIEASESLFRSSRDRLKDLPNVRCMAGDSRKELPTAISAASRPILFWLDAHYCGGSTHQAACPLLEEIGVINARAPDSYILVDDARFILSPWVGVQYCTLDALCKALENETQGRYTVVIEDVVVSVPLEARVVVEDYCYEVTLRLWQAHEARVRKPQSILQRAVNKLSRSISG